MLVIAALAMLVMSLWTLAPSERFGSVGFRVLFDGAERGRYPNGTTFSASEVVAPSVLGAVYGANDLQRYMKFDSFKESMFALEANRELELLSYEYQTKLADTRLSSVDRSRIEDEFRRRRESLQSAEFSLNLRRSERMKALPDSLLLKILSDTLAEWARQARERRGALKYDIPVFTRNILRREVTANEDYIIAVDVLRTQVNKIVENIDRISGDQDGISGVQARMSDAQDRTGEQKDDLTAGLPGASLIRTGKSQLSLAEIRSNLKDLLRFNIEPSISLITTTKLSRDPLQARVYLQDQLRQIRLDRQQAEQRMKAIQEPLRDYYGAQPGGRQYVTDSAGRPSVGGQVPLGASALIPQLSESFLQQIVDLSTQKEHTKYRQNLTDRVIREGLKVADMEKELAYYESLNASLSGWVKTTDTPEAKQLLARLDAAFQTVAKSLDDVNAIYEDLSTRNLNPATLLYTITSPASVRTQRTVSLGKLTAFSVIGFIFIMAMMVAACFAHNYYRRSVAEPAQTASVAADEHQRV